MNELDKMLQDKSFQFECSYHQYLMDLVFGDINPMLLNNQNEKKFKELVSQVASLHEQKHHYEKFKLIWFAENK